MKLTLQQRNETYTIESEYDDQDGADMIDFCCRILLAAGYSPKTVEDVIIDKAEQLISIHKK